MRETVETRLVSALLTCSSITAAAKKAGISRTTAYRYMRKPDFSEKLEKAKSEAVRGAVTLLQGGLQTCAGVLLKVALDANAPPQVRVNAVTAFMSQARGWTETVDVLGRLAKVEKSLEESESEVDYGRDYSKA